jgi:branched-chain amino acid transport system substrate-binding protein
MIGRIARAAALVLLLPIVARAQDVPLNVILSMTGNAAFLGQMRHATLQAMEKMLNDQGGIGGKPIRFVFHDDQTSPQVTVQITSSLIPEHPPVILGASITGPCTAELPMVRAHGPVAYCFSPGIHPPAGSYMFSAGVSTHDLIKVIFRYFLARGWTNVATLDSTDDSGQEMEGDIADALKLPEFADIHIVTEQHFNIGDISVAAQTERIRELKPDALVAWSTGTAVAGVFKAMIQAGLDVPVITSNGNMSIDVMRKFASFLPKTLMVPSPAFLPHQGLYGQDPRVEQKQQAYYAAMQAAKLPIDLNTAGVWDATLMVVDGLNKLGAQTTPTALRDWLAALKDYPGIMGVYDFPRTPQRGADQQDSLIARWDAPGDRWVPIALPGGKPLPSAETGKQP